MENIILNDGTFIYTKEDATDYLSSLGFNLDDLKEIFSDDIDTDAYEAAYREQELEADRCFCAARDMALETIEMLEEMSTHYTGVKTLSRINKIIDTINYYRVD